MLVVIAILGILAAGIAILINPGQKIASANNARVKSDLIVIAESAKRFNLEIDSGCRLGGSYPSGFPEDGLLSCGIKWYSPNQPKPPSGEYSYQAFPDSCLADPTFEDPGGMWGKACTEFSISGPAYKDPNSVPPVTNSASRWCLKSSSGVMTLAADGVCDP